MKFAYHLIFHNVRFPRFFFAFQEVRLMLPISPYVHEAELGICLSDPYLSIPWPLEISVNDTDHPLLNDKFMGIEI